MAQPTKYNKPTTLAKFSTASSLKQAGVSTYIAKRLLAEGLITKAGKVETGNRGRPAILFVLTEAGVSALNPVATTEA